MPFVPKYISMFNVSCVLKSQSQLSTVPLAAYGTSQIETPSLGSMSRFTTRSTDPMTNYNAHLQVSLLVAGKMTGDSKEATQEKIQPT